MLLFDATIETQDLNPKDLMVYICLEILYIVIYIPRVFRNFPSNYRSNVQRNMGYVAESLAEGVNPYTPPYPSYYSAAGGHLHGVAGAPFELLTDSPAAPRFGVLAMGFVSLLMFYTILKRLNISRPIAAGTTTLVLIYPQYILFHTAGNPSAADLFFGLAAVLTYIWWRDNESNKWLLMSSLASGAGVFNHFYSGVVAIGLVTHYLLTTVDSLSTKIRTTAIYGVTMIPAGVLLFVYKVFFNRLL